MGRRVGSRNELIKCEYCGEMYSVTYKHCPFCNEDGTGRWDDLDRGGGDGYDDAAPVQGGKRLAGGGGGRRGPTVRRIISTVVSLALIIAAAGIVISIVKSLLGDRKTPSPKPSAPVADSAAPTPSAAVVPSAQPTVDPDPAQTPTVVPSAQPGVQDIPSVDLVAPTAFKLNREDFTLDHAGEIFQMKAICTPENARPDITWTSSDPNVASVSWNGVVTAVSQGTVKVTASVAGVGEKSCIVRCNFKDTTTSTTTTQAPAASATPNTSLSLSREDFTLSKAGETWRLVVSGTGSAVTWASSNTAVASVGVDGTVTAIGSGTCNVTATVDGVTLKCIVRCSF